MRVWAVKRELADLSWERALEMATDNRDGAPGQGARGQSGESRVSFGGEARGYA
jgi:hypothetical protein